MSTPEATPVWSQRFAGRLHPRIAHFNTSLGFDIALLEYDILGSQAHAAMLAACGIITAAEGEQLQAGLAQVLAEWREGTFNPLTALDEDGNPLAEDVHYAVEKRLIERVGEVGKKLHTGRSRNDQVATDLRLYLRDQLTQIQGSLRALQATLLDLGDKHLPTVMPGYTHLQRAQPISLAHHLLAYVEMFERDWQRLQDLWGRVNICPLGSGALAGTSLPIDRHLTAHLLGFERVSNNSLDAVSDRDYLVEFHSAASLIMVHLSRLSEELILWASQEFAFITLTDTCATGSSLMPQKKNPDVPELIRGKSGRVFGHLQALLTTLKGLPLAYNKDLQEDKEQLFDSVATVSACLEAMQIFLETGITVQTDHLAQVVNHDFANATDVADYLVRKGIPFRSAHDLVGKMVRTCLEEGIVLQDLPLERWQAFSPVFEPDIFAVIDPVAVVAARQSYGGTGFDQVRAALDVARQRLL